MKTLLASALLVAGLAAGSVCGLAVTPASAAVEGLDGWPLPEFGAAATHRLDHAGNGADHWPSCTGQMNGTAHHSCGSATGGPAGGLF